MHDDYAINQHIMIDARTYNFNYTANNDSDISNIMRAI